jgi:hypothetical protein
VHEVFFGVTFVFFVPFVVKIVGCGQRPVEGGTPELDEQKILDQLEEAARSLGMEIRYETMKGESSFSPGGLCRLQGNYLLIINSRASLSEKIRAMAQAVNRFDLSQVYLLPGLRELLERLREMGEPASEEQ